MRVIKTITNYYICKRILERLRSEGASMEISFKTRTDVYPVRYWFYIGDKRSDFFFTIDTVNDLLKQTKFLVDSYSFVIDTIYYSCLKELVKNHE